MPRASPVQWSRPSTTESRRAAIANVEHSHNRWPSSKRLGFPGIDLHLPSLRLRPAVPVFLKISTPAGADDGRTCARDATGHEWTTCPGRAAPTRCCSSWRRPVSGRTPLPLPFPRISIHQRRNEPSPNRLPPVPDPSELAWAVTAMMGYGCPGAPAGLAGRRRPPEERRCQRPDVVLEVHPVEGVEGIDGDCYCWTLLFQVGLALEFSKPSQTGAGSLDQRMPALCGGDKVGSVTSGTWTSCSSRSAANVIIFGERSTRMATSSISWSHATARGAAKRFFRKVLKHQGRPPWQLVTDTLRSYPAAHRDVFPAVIHRTGQ